MTEEIFGPVFPVIEISDDGKYGTKDCGSFKEAVIDFVSSREKPLAFYYFGCERTAGKSSAGHHQEVDA